MYISIALARCCSIGGMRVSMHTSLLVGGFIRGIHFTQVVSDHGLVRQATSKNTHLSKLFMLVCVRQPTAMNFADKMFWRVLNIYANKQIYINNSTAPSAPTIMTMLWGSSTHQKRRAWLLPIHVYKAPPAWHLMPVLGRAEMQACMHHANMHSRFAHILDHTRHTSMHP